MSDIAMKPGPSRSFPRAPLVGAFALVLFSIVAAGIGRLTGAGVTPPPRSPVASREVLFQDQADGGVRVSDAGDHSTIEVMPPGTNGFARATLRTLANFRKVEQQGPDKPFRITAWADGRLTLDDTATGRRLELEAFGQTNEAAFVQLLARPRPAPGAGGGT